MKRMFGRRGGSGGAAVSLPGGSAFVQAPRKPTATEIPTNPKRRRYRRIESPRPGVTGRILAALGRLCVLDEDAVCVEKEHEAAERPLNRLRVDAQEAIARGCRSLDQRVESAHLELELRRADVLDPPA